MKGVASFLFECPRLSFPSTTYRSPVSIYFPIPATGIHFSARGARGPSSPTGKKQAGRASVCIWGCVLTHFWPRVWCWHNLICSIFIKYLVFELHELPRSGLASVISQLRSRHNLSNGLLRASTTCLQSLPTQESYLNVFHIPEFSFTVLVG